MRRLAGTIPAVAAILCLAGVALAEPRVKPPEIPDYTAPETTTPSARSTGMEYVDVAVLAAALIAASWLALRSRSRRGMFILVLVALGYFGFYRGGCVCPIGAIQNVSEVFAGFASATGTFLGDPSRAHLAGMGEMLTRPSITIPLVVVAFFLLPLIFTLFFGRTFCAAVCPLGAIQDVVALRPVRVPSPIEHALGLVPWLYLGTAVLLAVTGSLYVICRFDPFVGMFRLAAPLEMLLFGGALLLLGVFIARPYCRYLCPYGAILRPLSRLSWKHATITPDECIRCSLCADSCPYGAIREPTHYAARRREGKGRLVGAMVLLPLLIAGGGLLGHHLGPAVSRVHRDVRLADRVSAEKAGEVTGTTDESEAFYDTGEPVEAMYGRAESKAVEFVWGTAILGGFLGLVIGLKLISLNLRRTRTDYTPDRAKCLSCGRCFAYCPIEHQRREERKKT